MLPPILPNYYYSIVFINLNEKLKMNYHIYFLVVFFCMNMNFNANKSEFSDGHDHERFFCSVGHNTCILRAPRWSSSAGYIRLDDPERLHRRRTVMIINKKEGTYVKNQAYTTAVIPFTSITGTALISASALLRNIPLLYW